jgi:hypothetical protein
MKTFVLFSNGWPPPTFGLGLKKRPNFLKFSENWWNWAGPNSETAEFTVHCFKISKKR